MRKEAVCKRNTSVTAQNEGPSHLLGPLGLGFLEVITLSSFLALPRPGCC